MTVKQKPRMTEGEMTKLLRTYVCKDAGNGPSALLIEQVRDGAGFNSRRTIDAIGLGLWPSRGLYLTAYEIKCSRSDWLSELKNPDKAEAYAELVDFFVLVVADEAFVHPGELPEQWGLLAPSGRGLRMVKPPEALRDLSPEPGTRRRPLPPGFGREFLVPLMREAERQGRRAPDEWKAKVDEAVEQALDYAKRDHERVHEDNKALRETIRDFEQASGISLSTFRSSYGPSPAKLGVAARKVLNGEKEVERLDERLRNLRTQAAAIAESIENILNPTEKEPMF